MRERKIYEIEGRISSRRGRYLQAASVFDALLLIESASIYRSSDDKYLSFREGAVCIEEE